MPPETGPVMATPLLEGRVRLEGAPDGASLRPQVGMRTGAVESGMLLAHILAQAFAHLPRRWAEKGWAFFPLSAGASCLLWVDNLFVFGRSEDMVLEMLADVGEALRRHALFLKPSSLEVMRCGRVPVSHGASALPERAGRGPEGEELAARRVSVLTCLGYRPHASGKEREELEHHLRQADRAWYGIKRVVCARWAPGAARFKALAQRLWPIALPPGCGSWGLSKADCRALRAWELEKIRQALGVPHPRSAEDVAGAHRHLEKMASDLAARSGERRLLDRYLGCVHTRAAHWTADRNVAQGMWRWSIAAGDVVAWRALAPTLQRLDQRNHSTWKRSTAGRPRTTWAELVTELSGGAWTVAASGGTLPSQEQFVIKGLTWAGAPTPRPQTCRSRSGSARRRGGGDGQALLPALPRPVQGPAQGSSGGLVVQAFTDAKILADALRGEAAPAPSVHGALSSAAQLFGQLRQGGAMWALSEPVAWIPRELNQAADFLATTAAPLGESGWAAPLQNAQPCSLGVRVIAFSDGSSCDDAVGWAAVAAVATADGWQVVAAQMWRGAAGTRTVPQLEAAGIQAVASLLAAIVCGGVAAGGDWPSQRISAELLAQTATLLRAVWPAAWPACP